jgi:hypothetical protein
MNQYSAIAVLPFKKFKLASLFATMISSNLLTSPRWFAPKCRAHGAEIGLHEMVLPSPRGQ